MSLSTALAKVRGLGAAKLGTHHWIAQRFTAIALVPFSIWFLVSLMLMMRVDYQTVVAWIQSPPTAILLITFIIVLFHHAQLGMQIVIEDYIGCKVLKLTSLVTLKFASFFAALAATVSVLKIYLGS